MKAHGYVKVELRGTWSRTNTSRSDVHWYRRQLRKVALAHGAYADAQCFRTPLLDRGGDGRDTQHGTFRFDVELRSAGSNSLKRAEHLLKALMLECMCRPPVIKVDREKSTTGYFYSSDGRDVTF